MTKQDSISDYDDVSARLTSNRRHLLLGNGFSIACDPIFLYSSLFDAAVEAGLSTRAQKIFTRIGTNNFEGAMKLLDDAHWVATVYRLITNAKSQMQEDAAIIKEALVKAVATSHLAHSGKVSNEKKTSALEFLRPYYNIFTTNYDLLVYWVNMFEDPHARWKDGFHADEDDLEAPYVIFAERLGSQRGLFYLHGALHLYLNGGELRKHCWSRTHRSLTTLIRSGLDSNQYPLFVAEGSPKKKLEQIQRSGYLWYCLDKLARIENCLVIYGNSLGESDGHIAKVLADNLKLKQIAIGLHGDFNSPANKVIRNAARQLQARRDDVIMRRHAGNSELEILFYRSESAQVWG